MLTKSMLSPLSIDFTLSANPPHNSICKVLKIHHHGSHKTFFTSSPSQRNARLMAQQHPPTSSRVELPRSDNGIAFTTRGFETPYLLCKKVLPLTSTSPLRSSRQSPHSSETHPSKRSKTQHPSASQRRKADARKTEKRDVRRYPNPLPPHLST